MAREKEIRDEIKRINELKRKSLIDKKKKKHAKDLEARRIQLEEERK